MYLENVEEAANAPILRVRKCTDHVRRIITNNNVNFFPKLKSLNDSSHSANYKNKLHIHFSDRVAKKNKE